MIVQEEDPPTLIPTPAYDEQVHPAELRVALAAHLDEEGVEVHVDDPGRHRGARGRVR